jgi:ketosteroid isomerase-like protein
MDMTVEERLQRLEDRAELQQLQVLYAHHGDIGWSAAGADTQALAGLFTEDGVWESAGVGRFEGREAIAAGLSGGSLATAVHLLAATEPFVDGDTAAADWKVMLYLKASTDKVLLGAGTYVGRYRRTVEGWRIASLTMISAGMAPLA